MLEEIKVVSLNQFPNYAPILAFWSYREWYQKRDIDLNIVILDYISRSKNENIPVTFIALKNSLPIGMVTLKKNDLWSRKDLSPWLTSLYVDPKYINNGIASLLIDKIGDYAKEKGFDQFYLFIGENDNIDLENFYKKRGWKFLESAIDNDGLPTKIMNFTL